MRTIKLYGELGDLYGKEYRFNVTSVREALALLLANFPSLKQYLIDQDKKIAGYEVWDGKEALSEEDKNGFFKQGLADIKIIPVVQGGGAAGRIIAGAVLVVVGAILAYGSWGAASPYGGKIALLGASLILGGICELLSPKPNTKTSDPTSNADSYLFSGAMNSSKQGNAVALGYGKMIVGSQVGSASITITDIPV